MQINKSINVTILLSILTLLSGCAAYEQGWSRFGDSARTITEGCAGGTLLGGALGYLIGDHESENAANGAAAGAVVGCGAGYVIDQRKRAYATEEAYLDAQISRARHFNAALADYNSQLRERVADLEADIRSLQSQYAVKEIAQRKLNNKVAKAESLRRKADKSYNELKEERNILHKIYYREKRSETDQSTRLLALRTQIDRLDNHLATLRRTSHDLAGLEQAHAS